MVGVILGEKGLSGRRRRRRRSRQGGSGVDVTFKVLGGGIDGGCAWVGMMKGRLRGNGWIVKTVPLIFNIKEIIIGRLMRGH